MNQVEIIKLLPLFSALIAFLGVLLGALINYFLNRKKDSQERAKIRIENAYLLCQKLYDGYKKELIRLKSLEDKSQISNWLKQRDHPGEYMNEIKMIIYIYAPKLKTQLNYLDQNHQALKKGLNSIENLALEGSLSLEAMSIKDLEYEFKGLEQSMDTFKQALITHVK